MRLICSPRARSDVDEDELLAELEYEEEELAATASADQGGSFEIVLVGVLTVSLLVGGSALAAGYGSAGFNRQKTVEGSFGGIKGAAPAVGGVYSGGVNKTQALVTGPATPTPTPIRAAPTPGRAAPMKTGS
jgi:hypothetical protein